MGSGLYVYGSLVLLHITSAGIWAAMAGIVVNTEAFSVSSWPLQVVILGSSQHGDFRVEGILTGQLASPSAGFLSLSTTDILEWTILSCE